MRLFGISDLSFMDFIPKIYIYFKRKDNISIKNGIILEEYRILFQNSSVCEVLSLKYCAYYQEIRTEHIARNRFMTLDRIDYAIDFLYGKGENVVQEDIYKK